MLAEGAAPVETIDALVKAMGFRAGPFAQMDQVGLDLTFAVSTSLHEASFGDPHFRPHPLLAEMVDAGLVGRKAGRGFYDYRTE